MTCLACEQASGNVAYGAITYSGISATESPGRDTFYRVLKENSRAGINRRPYKVDLNKKCLCGCGCDQPTKVPPPMALCFANEFYGL